MMHVSSHKKRHIGKIMRHAKRETKLSITTSLTFSVNALANALISTLSAPFNFVPKKKPNITYDQSFHTYDRSSIMKQSSSKRFFHDSRIFIYHRAFSTAHVKISKLQFDRYDTHVSALDGHRARTESSSTNAGREWEALFRGVSHHHHGFMTRIKMADISTTARAVCSFHRARKIACCRLYLHARPRSFHSSTT